MMSNESVMTGEFRVSYPNVLKPNDDGKYTVSMLFDKKKLKSNKAELAKYNELKAMVNKLLEKNECEQGPFRDGDERTTKDGKPDPVYAGKIYAEAKTQFEPEVFDRNRQDIISEKDFEPGCYARARVHAYHWTFKNKEGVALGFDAIQKLHEALPGDPKIESRSSAKDSFDELDDAGDDVSSSDDDLLA